ncbi:MAG: hypothetical protein A2W90_22435 [Bacteroidetes bacterium GWF2_42_66]|nr:MAG: hypothetical protein A2W92_21840 [Bacteroidetes bacterium GWA2_42_15]OFY03094.1 MAG: hypothetical protein A2W89_13215 [Bacteroidetes bacterium GWE2_42_39]OFY45202.1 MAG: hypothetical protein A2W90_22435 [Bacteroidetes bacterium GWF2_42_66]HBL74146.1 hypothetical protein [Prolixibacteraceae bacterium]HCR90601.1 hypothetical protein [Prolixibacteraceae bacterium]
MFKKIAFIISIFCVFNSCGRDNTKSKFLSITKNIEGKTIKITKVAEGKVIHRFFDTSPISPSGKYLALFRFPSETSSPKPGEKGEIILINLETGDEKTVGYSRGFEMQLGANVQWGSSDEELFFNDVDTTDWSAFAVLMNPLTGEIRKMEGTVFMTSLDGKKLASYNLKSSRFAQVGYGVVVPDQYARRNIGVVDSDGIFVTDVASGKCHMIVSIRDIYEKTTPSIKISNPDEYEYYCFQVKWNPQTDKLLTTIQWAPVTGGNRRRAVITMNPDGTDLRTAITPELWSNGGHHVNWTPDGRHLSMNLNIDKKPGLEIITVKYDGSDMKTIYSPGSGHPSLNPSGLQYIITDAYPGENIGNNSGKGVVPIRLINISSQTEIIVDNVFLSSQVGEFRIDAHPAWDRHGKKIIYNGFEKKTRCVFVATLDNFIIKNE